jgi:integrase
MGADMADRLSDKVIRSLAPPAAGNGLHWDAPDQRGGAYVPGLGICVTAKGYKSFILNYRLQTGRQRRLVIGSWPVWTVSAAREEAAKLRRKIDMGEDPKGERDAEREAPVIKDLAARAEAEYFPKLRPGTQRNYRAFLKNDIVPLLGGKKVAEVSFTDIDKLHRRICQRGSPIQANRAVALISVLFNLAIRWGWCRDNPCKGLAKTRETPRERYLDPAEIARLGAALAARPCASAHAISLALLTGARIGEVLGATWDQFNVQAGTWLKSASRTKQRRSHLTPLSAPAQQLLADMRAKAEPGQPYLFPGAPGKPQGELKKFWASVCRDAEIEGARVHDLRHSFASVLASSGLSLPIIGALLGHSSPQVTSRYSHLMLDPLRQAVETAGAVITGGGDRR